MVVITSNGLSSDKLLYDLFPYTQNLSTAVIVKTASNPVPGEDKSLPWLEDELQMLRLSVDWFDFDTDDPAELLRYDVVEMSGGDPFYLRESIRKANAESILKKIAEEKILIGISAGAIVQQQDMRLIPEMEKQSILAVHGGILKWKRTDHTPFGWFMRSLKEQPMQTVRRCCFRKQK